MRRRYAPLVGCLDGITALRANETNASSSSSPSGGDAHPAAAPIDEVCEPLSVPFEDRCEYVVTTPSCSLENQSSVAFIKLPEGILLRRARREFSERTLCVLADRAVLPRARDGRGVLFLPSFGEDFGIFEVERRRRGRDVVGVWERRPGYFRADAALNDLSSNEETSGIPLALGAVLGAGMFIAFIVFPSVVLAAPESNLNSRRLRSGRRVGGYVEVDKTLITRLRVLLFRRNSFGAMRRCRGSYL